MVHNQNYTTEEIADVLKILRDCVKSKDRIILVSEDRQKNVSFMQNHQLSSAEIDRILLGIQVSDFCYTTLSKSKDHTNDLLYVFAPDCKLRNLHGVQSIVKVYIKFTFQGNTKKKVVVISFHELEFDISYAFK